MKTLIRSMLAAAVIALPSTAPAQDSFPTKPVTIISPFSPGASDTPVRAILEALSRELGQSVVVENKAGAGGAIGATAVKQSAPDGYTLLGTTLSVLTLLPNSRNVDYSLDDFVPVGKIAGTRAFLHGRAEAPYRNLAELVEYARANPGVVKFGSGGQGSASHIAGEMIQALTGVTLLQVPFKGNADAFTALLAGEIDLTYNSAGFLKEHVDAGTLRWLAVASDERYPLFPEVPTFKEQGVDFADLIEIGIFAPKGTPEAVLNRLEAAIATAHDDSGFRKSIDDILFLWSYGDAAQLQDIVNKANTFWHGIFATYPQLRVE